MYHLLVNLCQVVYMWDWNFCLLMQTFMRVLMHTMMERRNLFTEQNPSRIFAGALFLSPHEH